MKNKEIELILTKLKIVRDSEENGAYICDREHSKLILSYIEQLEKRNESLLEDRRELLHLVRQLENNRDKAIEVINTQLKNAEGGTKDNLRTIKFNLIKGSCTFEDLKTEEDYKYILKGDSDVK